MTMPPSAGERTTVGAPSVSDDVRLRGAAGERLGVARMLPAPARTEGAGAVKPGGSGGSGPRAGRPLPKQLQDVVVSTESVRKRHDGAQSRDRPVVAERVVYNRGLRKLRYGSSVYIHWTSGRAGGRLFQTNIEVEPTVEHRPMQFLTRPGARALVAVACLAGLVTPAHAQQPPAAPLPTRHHDDRSGRPAVGPQRPLSINEAVDLALKQNLGIQIERLNPQLQDYTLRRRWLNYTPVFGGGVNYNNQHWGLIATGPDARWSIGASSCSPSGTRRGIRARAAAIVCRLQPAVEREERAEPVARRSIPRPGAVRADHLRRGHARAHSFVADGRRGTAARPCAGPPWNPLSASRASSPAGAAINTNPAVRHAAPRGSRGAGPFARVRARPREHRVPPGLPALVPVGRRAPSAQFSLSRRLPERRHRCRLPHQQDAAITLQRPSDLGELGCPRRRQRTATRSPLERLRQLVVEPLRQREVR